MKAGPYPLSGILWIVRFLLLLCSLLLSVSSSAQSVADTVYPAAPPAARVADNKRGFLISYANDVFAKTDRYFTQGVLLQIAHPAVQHLDRWHVLSPIAKPTVYYTASLLHESYTPSSIRSDNVLREDRPYAALAAIKLEGFAYGGKGVESISSAVTLGVIGPPAQGREIQTAIHRATGDFIPLGWQHQIRTDVLINYGIEYRRSFLRSSVFRLTAVTSADAGTLQSRLGAGLMAMLRPLATTRSAIQPSFFAAANGRLIGYDARLQGGVFNRRSPYVLTASQISRTVGSAIVQLRLDYQKMGVGGEYNWLSREFVSGQPHAWGRLFVQHSF